MTRRATDRASGCSSSGDSGASPQVPTFAANSAFLSRNLSRTIRLPFGFAALATGTLGAVVLGGAILRFAGLGVGALATLGVGALAGFGVGALEVAI